VADYRDRIGSGLAILLWTKWAPHGGSDSAGVEK